MTLSIETPALLFSATSLILLAYTNRFLTIAQIIRNLKKNYDDNHNKSILLEIKNLNLRLTLIRYMQLFGVMCLLTAIYFSELTQNASLLFFRKKINENIAEKICLKLKPEPNFADKTLC